MRIVFVTRGQMHFSFSLRWLHRFRCNCRRAGMRICSLAGSERISWENLNGAFGWKTPACICALLLFPSPSYSFLPLFAWASAMWARWSCIDCVVQNKCAGAECGYVVTSCWRGFEQPTVDFQDVNQVKSLQSDLTLPYPERGTQVKSIRQNITNNPFLQEIFQCHQNTLTT